MPSVMVDEALRHEHLKVARVRQFGLYPLWTQRNLRVVDPSKFCYFTQKCVMTMWLITVKPSHGFGSRIMHDMVQCVYNLLEDRNPLKGNTVGSQPETEKAYIAGFLDGDGSIMLQLKKRNDTTRGYRFMATICLYQDTRHEEPLHWMRNVFNIGYVSRRRDGMSELRVNGYKKVREILEYLQPYLRFKRVQASAMIQACNILETTPLRMLSKEQLVDVIDLVLMIQNENYATHRKRTRERLLKEFGLTP